MSEKYFTLPYIDPNIFGDWGMLSPKWYGLMYLIGFAAAWFLAHKRKARLGWSSEQLDNMLFYGFLGVVLGGRIGYVLFYQFERFIEDPTYLFMMTEGGMSFHGGLIGVITALWISSRLYKTRFLKVGDFIAPFVPIGLGAGRIGNFINGELWGRTTDVPWAIIFPTADNHPRHPSQLYEFALEGVVLFIILWFFSQKPRPTGAVGGLFLAGYGCFRFFVEYFREPDKHIGLYAEFISQGQILSLPMILIGVGLIVWAYRNGSKSVINEASGQCKNT